jgi:hypothetical protein
MVIIEHVASIHAKGEAILAADPENLDGLRLIGALSQRVYSAIAEATYKIDVPDLERLSDVAAQGRECVARFPGVGPGAMTELDTLLVRFGLTWNPRPRPFGYRTDKNKHPLLKLWDKDRELREQQETRSQFWSAIVRSVGKMERDIGSALLKDHPNRDSVEGVSCRLSYLSGYIESWAEYRRRGAMHDITPEPDAPDDGEYETAGNLICLPGVSLTSVLWTDDTDDPGPSAA